MTIHRVRPSLPVADPDSIGRLERALQASEERFQTLMLLSFDVYWESDSQHRFTRQHASPWLANTPAPGFELGKTRWELPCLEPDEEGWRQHRAVLNAHLPFRDFEFARPTAGGVRYVSVSGVPVFGEDGAFLGYRGGERDITEHKRTEALNRLHLWVLESTDRVSRALQGAQDIDALLAGVLEAALDIFSCDRAWVVECRRAESSAWIAIAEQARTQFSAVAAETELDCGDALSAVLGAALAAEGAVQALPAALAERHGIRAHLAIALQPQGADHPRLLCLHQCTKARGWSDEEARLLRDIAGRLDEAWGSLVAVRKLRESERRLAAAQSLARVGWWERDYLTGRVTLSDEASRIFGVDPVDLPHWQGKWLGLIHPDDRARVAEASDAALRGGPRYDVEYRVVRPDGAVRMVRSQGDVSWDESGRPVRQFGVMQDVTGLWQAQQGLCASEARFRTFVDRATDAFFLMDRQGNILDVNRQACDGLGLSRDELIGLHPRAFDPVMDETTQKRVRERVAAGGIATFETRHRRKDGSTFPVEIRSGSFVQNGELYVLALARDITDRVRAEEELRASEARFRTFVDRAADAFFLMDEELIVVDVNRQACEGLGYSRDELIGMHPPRDFDAGLDELPSVDEVVADVSVTFETRHRRRDGSVFPVEIRTGMFLQGGRRFYLALARDVTQRKRADERLAQQEQALQAARAQLAHVSRLTMLGELASSIAHEVSQPLGAMMTSTGACARWLAMEPPHLEEARAALGNIAADGRRAREVIARIRALIKRQVARRQRVDINQEVAEVLALGEREMQAHGILRCTDLDLSLPPASGDRIQLQQVLLNLILNAAEAMSSVTGRARMLTIASRRHGDDAIEVEVSDTGCGLDPARLEQVFEPFYTTKEEGVGIGLSISRSIVEAHGGRLWARANHPYGAAFHFKLPVEGKTQP